MIEREQFVGEFLKNMQLQGYKLNLENVDRDLELINEICFDYLYQISPCVAILLDPRIIDATRKNSLK